jgi:hypothetical protein
VQAADMLKRELQQRRNMSRYGAEISDFLHLMRKIFGVKFRCNE